MSVGREIAGPSWGPPRATGLPKIAHLGADVESRITDIGEYTDLIGRFRELNIEDDGIKFNYKIKYILEGWNQVCVNIRDVEKSGDALYEECLHNEKSASKLVMMISARSFIEQRVRGWNIRYMFLRKLRNGLQEGRKDPVTYRNGVRMWGEFSHKAKMSNGKPFTVMVSYLLRLLIPLLKSPHVLDLQQFAYQVFLNGAAIRALTPKLDELFTKIKNYLICQKEKSRERKVWLLMSVEIFMYGTLPAHVLKFYQEQVGGDAMAMFQTNQPLSIRTPEDNQFFKKYQSDVDVLQLATKPE